MKILEECLRQDEGEVLEVYLDIKGKPTGGVGHHFYVGSKIPKEVSDILLRHDIAEKAVNEYYKLPRSYTKHLNKARARVINCMLFNMRGYRSLIGFKKMWAAIICRDWAEAKRQMLDSNWAREVGDGPGGRMDRAERLANIMLTGVWPGEDLQ